MKNYNIILHTTTACNFDCSYCDVIKDRKMISKENIEEIIIFMQKNSKNINRFKFFGGEPLINWKTIKYIIDNSQNFLGNNFEIVTNTTLLNDEIGEYFQKYFCLIFFSIDSENIFDFEENISFIKKYSLEKKLYFNLIIDPKNIENAKKQFEKLYNSGMRGFNILPVYFTKSWEKEDLQKFSQIIKEILDLSQKDTTLRLYGFTENNGEKSSLINNSLFIDIKNEIFFSDFPSTFLGQKIKNELFLGNVKDFLLKDLKNNFEKQEKIISDLEKSIYNTVKGQKELHKIMDYFSQYLNKKYGK